MIIKVKGIDRNKWQEIEIPSLPRTGDCRYCKHSQWLHNFDERGNRPCRENSERDLKAIGPNGPISIFIPKPTIISQCPCMEYVPGDNLAYLEWIEKRGY